MKIIDLLNEMAIPSDNMRSKVYYHGCSNSERGKNILKQGISPQQIEGRSIKGKLTPVTNKIYITQDISYALIYAMGAAMVGKILPEDMIEKDGRYGWLFVIDGKDLQDIQPDEDSVGEFLSKNSEPIYIDRVYNGQTFKSQTGIKYKNNDDPENSQMQQVWKFIYNSMTEKQRKDAADGFIDAQASGGKRVLKSMPDWMKLSLIRWGSHVAHHGKIIPVQAWRIDKTKCKKYEHDGSNVFELSKRIR